MKAYIENSFTALGDPNRRAIFQRVASSPASVGAIAASMPISRPAVSQHLRVLKDAGLVEDEPQGTRRVYRARAEGLAALRNYLDELWAANLKSFAKAAERRSIDDTGRGRD